MYISKVMDLRAPRIASSIAGKISSPFSSVWARLPASSGGPSMTFMVRANCGSATEYKCGTSRSIALSPRARLAAISTTRPVAATASAIKAMRRSKGLFTPYPVIGSVKRWVDRHGLTAQILLLPGSTLFPVRDRKKIRVGLKVIHRHRVGEALFRRVSELVSIEGRPKALLGWINVGGVRTP